MDRNAFDWPFFEDRHRALAAETGRWAAQKLAGQFPCHGDDHPDDLTGDLRGLVTAFGAGGMLRYVVPGDGDGFDLRALCLIREILAYHSGLAESAFGVQGLGSAPISIFGNQFQRNLYLPALRDGRAIAAFALSEPEAGSDAGALTTQALPVEGGWMLNGTKTWISNGGVADLYTVFARTGEAGPRGISAFIVPADAPGFSVVHKLETVAPHPMAMLRFADCRVGEAQLLGMPGMGFQIAMRTLDLFRASVGAAALGFARRAFDEAIGHAENRVVFGKRLGDFQLTQARLADMATLIDTAALAVYRAAWAHDRSGRPITAEASMAKMHASEAAQSVIDSAVQLLGARGVQAGSPAEALYREIRSVRIYDGATEIQKLIIARHARAAYRSAAACPTA